MPLQIRRGTDAERLEETFALGELIYVTDEQKLVVGDGTTQGGIVVSTDVDTETVQNITANMFTEGNHTNIAFAYDTTAGTINATVDLSELDILDFEGVFRADGFQGSIFLNDSSLFLDVEFNTVFFDNIRTVGSIIPDEDLSYSIGDEDFRFASVHASELYLDGALVTSFNGSIDLPAGTTVDGGEILAEGGQYRITVLGEDSTVLVDSFLNILSNGNISIAGDEIISDLNVLSIGNEELPLNLSLNLSSNLQIFHVLEGEVGLEDINGYITVINSRGSHNFREALQPGDELGGLLLRGHTDESTPAIAGLISFFVDPTAVITPGANFIKSQVAISVSSDTGQEETDAFVLDSAGIANSNAFVANKFMQLAVYENDAARSTSISTPAKGMMIFMESGTDPAATNQMQVYDGTNWVNVT